MIFFPVAFILFLAFVLIIPILFVFGYFGVVTLGFEKMGFSSEATLAIFFAILIGSAINIPLTGKKFLYVEERSFWGLWRTPKLLAQRVSINLGGAVIPVLLSIYFLFMTLQKGFPLKPILIATILMIIISKALAKINPQKGITMPTLMPPIISAIIALIVAPDFAASCAFISGVLGVLIGADLLNLKKIQKMGSGFISIGGAGVFDGIFLIGIASSLLANL
ncbi:MAG: DUF1614 domain-containing protein [Patescibacteria group bacterium]